MNKHNRAPVLAIGAITGVGPAAPGIGEMAFVEPRIESTQIKTLATKHPK